MNVIFDVDGTLLNIEHRRHFVSNGNNDWESFLDPVVMEKDTPNWPVVEIARKIQQDVELVVVSARNERHREVTQKQLEACGLHPAHLFLRPDGDFRSDKEFKQEVLDSLRNNGWEPNLVFDDRNQVVEMWRANGVPCFQVADGDF
jgi:FMN phosphatase YigB (HAD superfamily)